MIEIKNLNKKFAHNELFSDLNLQIALGEITIIYGKSGAGKTTLLNIIGGLEQADSGQILISGSQVKHSRETRLKTFNYIFQNFALIENMSIEENLKIALKYKKLSKIKASQKISDVLAYVDISNNISDKIYNLSGGEQQRIAIARSILKGGDIILADEPTGSLDDENKENVMNILSKLNEEGKTIIIVTHDKSLKQYANNIIELT